MGCISEGKRVAGVLLAAGRGTRTGLSYSKLLLDFGSSSIIKCALYALLESKLAYTVIVTGFDAESVTRAVLECSRQMHAEARIRLVLNSEYEQGMASSIRAGVAKVEGSDAILIALADMPLVTSELVNSMIELYLQEQQMGHHPIVMPSFKGKRGHPVIFDSVYRNELMSIQGDVGAREVVFKHESEVRLLEWGAEALLDVDELEDRMTLMREVRHVVKSGNKETN